MHPVTHVPGTPSFVLGYRLVGIGWGVSVGVIYKSADLSACDRGLVVVTVLFCVGVESFAD